MAREVRRRPGSVAEIAEEMMGAYADSVPLATVSALVLDANEELAGSGAGRRDTPNCCTVSLSSDCPNSSRRSDRDKSSSMRGHHALCAICRIRLPAIYRPSQHGGDGGSAVIRRPTPQEQNIRDVETVSHKLARPEG